MERMRQQNDARQRRSNGRSMVSGRTGNAGSNWFRLGVITATVAAPLIARWNDLRTSDRAQTLREMAMSRLSDARDARDSAAVRLAPVRAAAGAQLNSALALASDKLGDAREMANARLSDARVVANDRFNDAIERLAQTRTPDVLRNVPPFSLAVKRAQDLAQQRQRRRRQRMFFWLAGVAVGLVAAGATAFVLARRRMTTPIEDDDAPMVELPTARNFAEAAVGNKSTSRNTQTSPATASSERAEISVPVDSIVGVTSPDQARYIGNVRTMIFRSADDTGFLPAEENRIYFASESAAREAGYRMAREPESFAPSDEE